MTLNLYSTGNMIVTSSFPWQSGAVLRSSGVPQPQRLFACLGEMTDAPSGVFDRQWNAASALEGLLLPLPSFEARSASDVDEEDEDEDLNDEEDLEDEDEDDLDDDDEDLEDEGDEEIDEDDEDDEDEN